MKESPADFCFPARIVLGSMWGIEHTPVGLLRIIPTYSRVRVYKNIG